MKGLKTSRELRPWKASSKHVEWESSRRENPILQLSAIRDNLEWLFAGEPDPEISMDFWALCSDATEAAAVGRYLEEFWEKHPSIFQQSGWVSTFAGRVLLEDKNATPHFVKAYWKQARPRKSRECAYRALRRIQGKHKGHWKRAASQIEDFRARNHTSKESDSRFAARAIEAYGRSNKHCSCLTDSNLNAIAEAVLDHPKRPPSQVSDYALAKAFSISHGTLTHVRAEVARKYGSGL